jgi:hypothetical protein
MPVDVAVLRRLYAVPPGEFVAARNAAAKELRAAGDKDAAVEVAKLRRPPVEDWALNAVAVDHADQMGAALDAAARMRDAQAAAVEGREGADVRGAVADLREHSQRVVSLAADAVARTGRAPGAMVGTLTARLAEVAANEAAAEQLRDAHLGSESVETVGLFAGLTPPPRARAKKDDRAASPPVRTKRDRAAGTTASGGSRPDARTRRRLERAVAAAEKAQAAADAALAKAEERVEAAGEAVTEAEAAVETARARLVAAQDEQRTAVEESAQAQAALEAAESALAAG